MGIKACNCGYSIRNKTTWMLLTGCRNHHEKTIEGDLFSAFVAAGAISKANADDPKKSSLIRCARTDKGVHAAGNLISLKLIVEDPDIVAKINEQLNPQIRVWGIERTNGSFSAYQFCDSRIYEYLIPTHCFLPPHPKSFLAKKMVELAEEADDMRGYLSRQEDILDFWSEAEEKYMKPAQEKIDPSLRECAVRLFYEHTNTIVDPPELNKMDGEEHMNDEHPARSQAIGAAEDAAPKDDVDMDDAMVPKSDNPSNPEEEARPQATTSETPKELTPLETAVRLLKAAQNTAKKAHRIRPVRIARIQAALSHFESSHKYHNYTIDKTHKDPSATRIIRTFKVDEKPIVIGETEWLSLKVHGQSFMMHQIRKMVSMVALIVRCGCPEDRIQQSYLANKISIPKAPSLGLLLERPVFDVYNEKLEQFGREKIDFSRHEKEMEEFKRREIYERIFREEERDGCFHSFFAGLDNTRSSQLFYLSSAGVEAVKKELPKRSTESTEKVNVEEVVSEDENAGGDEG